MATKTDKVPPGKAAAEKNNVILAGKAEPLGAGPINAGMTELPPLPDEETQKAGFYYPQANLLLQMYPDRFKRVTEKGA